MELGGVPTGSYVYFTAKRNVVHGVWPLHGALQVPAGEREWGACGVVSDQSDVDQLTQSLADMHGAQITFDTIPGAALFTLL